jgi:hypothetical protein
MLIKQLTTSWPPRAETEQRPNLEDRVVGARKHSDSHLVLILRKSTTKTVYGLLLRLPEDLFGKAINAINDRIGITLRQVGELDISSPCILVARGQK